MIPTGTVALMCFKKEFFENNRKYPRATLHSEFILSTFDDLKLENLPEKLHHMKRVF